ncbi:TPA: hypothetical protein ACG4ML_001400, partial [Stenotrophomonas maltophilia]
VSRMDAAAKPTGTYLRRPRTPTPPHQSTECPLLLLLLPLQVQGCKPCQQKSAGVKSFAQIKKDLKPYMGQ